MFDKMENIQKQRRLSKVKKTLYGLTLLACIGISTGCEAIRDWQKDLEFAAFVNSDKEWDFTQSDEKETKLRDEKGEKYEGKKRQAEKAEDSELETGQSPIVSFKKGWDGKLRYILDSKYGKDDFEQYAEKKDIDSEQGKLFYKAAYIEPLYDGGVKTKIHLFKGGRKKLNLLEQGIVSEKQAKKAEQKSNNPIDWNLSTILSGRGRNDVGKKVPTDADKYRLVIILGNTAVDSYEKEYSELIDSPFKK
jgi:hypothetical protein